MPTRNRKQTSEQQDAVGAYLEAIGRHDLLTKEDEARLGRLVMDGLAALERVDSNERLSAKQRRKLNDAIADGQRARDQFVVANLRLVVSIARRYQSTGLPLGDLIQLGNLGLMHAVEKFDFRKGFKFSTYATWWIRQAITRGYADTARLIRLPAHAEDTYRLVARVSDDLEARLGRAATDDEVAEASGASGRGGRARARARELVRAVQRPQRRRARRHGPRRRRGRARGGSAPGPPPARGRRPARAARRARAVHRAPALRPRRW